MVDALVVDLADAARALRAREVLVRLLSSYSWFIGARLTVKPDGQLVLVAVTTSPIDPEQRAAVLARVTTHLGDVQLETLVGRAETVSPSWRAREQPGKPARKEDEQ
jgi:hypothetical protein